MKTTQKEKIEKSEQENCSGNKEGKGSKEGKQGREARKGSKEGKQGRKEGRMEGRKSAYEREEANKTAKMKNYLHL